MLVLVVYLCKERAVPWLITHEILISRTYWIVYIHASVLASHDADTATSPPFHLCALHPIVIPLQKGTVKKCKASKINADESTVTLATGETLPYDFLVLATGILHPKTGKEDGEHDGRDGERAQCFFLLKAALTTDLGIGWVCKRPNEHPRITHGIYFKPVGRRWAREQPLVLAYNLGRPERGQNGCEFPPGPLPHSAAYIKARRVHFV